MIMANKKTVPLKDEEIDTLDELQDKLQTCINAFNSLSSKINSQPTNSVDVEKFKAEVASAAKSAVEKLLDDRQKQREEKDKNDKEKYGITQDEYMGSLSERYDIVLSRCEGLLNIIEKERALAFSLNDRYKKSDDCIKIIGNTLDSICEKLGGANNSWRNAAINAQDIKGSSVISAMHHSLVLDKAHLAFSPC